MGSKIIIKSQKSQKIAAFPARWHKSILKRQADQEKMRISLIEQINRALRKLEKKYYWDEPYLFVSVAQKGKFRRNSDIDIAVLGLNSLEHYAFTGEISELLDKRVDVVLIEECRFARSIKEKGLIWNRRTGS
jgi:predicted nucleotidyltransferase